MKKTICFLPVPLFFSIFFFHANVFAKPIKLTYSSFFPPTHNQSELAQAWCDEVKKRTNSQVTIYYYPGQTLIQARQLYNGVVNGLSDIGMVLFADTRERFPVMEGVELPVGYSSGIQATRVANEVYDEFKPKELMDTQVMYLHAHGPGLLHTREKAVRTIDDFNGLKFRGQGTSTLVIKSLGGTPISMPMSHLYQSLQKGIVKGAFYPVEVNKGGGMGEVTNYLTISNSIAGTSSFCIVMNKDKWNKIPANLQKTIQKINAEWVVKHGEAWDESDKIGFEYIKSRGHEIIELSTEEEDQWENAVTPVFDEYMGRMDNKGLDGLKIVDFVKASVEKNK